MVLIPIFCDSKNPLMTDYTGGGEQKLGGS